KLFIHKNKISIIENGVDTNKFKKRNNNEIDKLSTYFNIDRNSDVVVGMIGRLWPQKNPMLLLYAAKNIINNNKRVKFLFVGDGELKDSMNDYIIQNKLTQNITICGWCNDVSSYLNIFDIFVLPSLWEGMPLAILEAESSSLPCIVSNIPGNRSIIRHTVDGYLFSLDNPSELESYINILIEDKERRIILGNNARVKILESYKIENRILKLDELYSSISLKE
ncbi:glycosyltransferase, partial [Escherichia coli]|nr:glycosyltransferase [Escherichia coli]